jgi:uncharacterized protein YhfF
VLLTDGSRIDRPSYYRVGHDYPVRAGRGPAEMRIKITAVRVEALGAITLQDAQAEGYRTTDEFKIAWVRAHDEAWVERHKVDLAEVFDDDVSVVDWILLERFRRSHAHRRVRVLVFDVLRDQPRYMATQRDILSGRSDGDYTPNRHRAIDESECPPDPAYVLGAREDGARRRASFRSDLEEERTRRKQARVQALRRVA